MIRILLADDHRMFRDGLRAALEDIPEMRIVAEAENGAVAVKLTLEHKPDVVLMDISMPEVNGVEATKAIMAALPKTRVIALTMNAERQVVEDMLAVGAAGFVLKANAFEELAAAIKKVVAGKTYLCQDIAAYAVEDFVGKLRNTTPAERAGLTNAETEVLRLIGEGHNAKAIAVALGISVRTADAHRANICKKLNANSSAELTKHAISFGLTDLNCLPK